VQGDDDLTVAVVVLHTSQGSPHFSLLHVLPEGTDLPYVVVDSNLTPGILACRDMSELQDIVDERHLYPSSFLLKRKISDSRLKHGLLPSKSAQSGKNYLDSLTIPGFSFCSFGCYNSIVKQPNDTPSFILLLYSPLDTWRYSPPLLLILLPLTHLGTLHAPEQFYELLFHVLSLSCRYIVGISAPQLPASAATTTDSSASATACSPPHPSLYPVENCEGAAPKERIVIPDDAPWEPLIFQNDLDFEGSHIGQKINNCASNSSYFFSSSRVLFPPLPAGISESLSPASAVPPEHLKDPVLLPGDFDQLFGLETCLVKCNPEGASSFIFPLFVVST